MRSTADPGTDTLVGGAGDDRIDARRSRDVVAGGEAATPSARATACATDHLRPGRDRVTADRRDKVARDCEVVRRG